MVCGRNKVAAESVHFGKRTYHTGIAEIICVNASCKARAACGFYGYYPVVLFAAKLFAHERRDQSAEIGSAARTSDYHVGNDTVFIKRGLCLKTDHALVKEYLVKNASEHISVSGIGRSNLNCFGDRTSETSCRARMLRVDLLAYLCFHRRRRCHACTVCTHNFTSEGLLLI